MIARFLSAYGMLLVLAVLCLFLSVWTINEQHPSGSAAAEQVGNEILAHTLPGAHVVILARDGREDQLFAETLAQHLLASGRTVAARVNGQPSEAAAALRKLAQRGIKIDALAVTKEAGDWAIFERFDQTFPGSAGAPVFRPRSYFWPDFLKVSNLLNVANQIAVIAIMAIGMTMVIIAGGIDLSVGSLLALSAVLTALLIHDWGGGREASIPAMVLCSFLATGTCALIGLANGALVTVFRVPAFIVTLGVMLMARGIASRLTEGQSVFGLPNSFTWLGRESAWGLVPNSVLLMVALYVVAHLLMAQTVLGRYIYAVGGNREAARLSGVPTQGITLTVYVISGALAGLGGVITASQLQSGGPTYGMMYELYVIAAVVVGGTSLSGGEGKIFGTLIGAFLIGVIQNGMNLLGLRSWDQEIVLGGVIIVAVLLDRVKQLGWFRRRGT